MTTSVDSVEVREIAPGETIKYSAWFGPSLYGDTLSSVTSVTQTVGATALTIGSGAINSGGAVTVDGVSRTASTVVQYLVTVPAGATLGECVVTVTAVTAAGLTRLLRCRFRVV